MPRRIRIRPSRNVSAFLALFCIGILIIVISFIAINGVAHPSDFLWVALLTSSTLSLLSDALSERGAASAMRESDQDVHESRRSVTERLQELSCLRDEGLITEDEFELKRCEILNKL